MYDAPINTSFYLFFKQYRNCVCAPSQIHLNAGEYLLFETKLNGKKVGRSTCLILSNDFTYSSSVPFSLHTILTSEVILNAGQYITNPKLFLSAFDELWWQQGCKQKLKTLQKLSRDKKTCFYIQDISSWRALSYENSRNLGLFIKSHQSRTTLPKITSQQSHCSSSTPNISPQLWRVVRKELCICLLFTCKVVVQRRKEIYCSIHYQHLSHFEHPDRINYNMLSADKLPGQTLEP